VCATALHSCISTLDAHAHLSKRKWTLLSRHLLTVCQSMTSTRLCSGSKQVQEQNQSHFETLVPCYFVACYALSKLRTVFLLCDVAIQISPMKYDQNMINVCRASDEVTLPDRSPDEPSWPWQWHVWDVINVCCQSITRTVKFEQVCSELPYSTRVFIICKAWRTCAVSTCKWTCATTYQHFVNQGHLQVCVQTGSARENRTNHIFKHY
jgi:hypothetical protein